MARKNKRFEEIEIEKSEPAFKIVKEDILTGTGLHFHNYLECELVVGGSSAQLLNGTHIPIKRGSLYLLRPMLDMHIVEPHPISVCKFYVKVGEISESLYNKLLLLATPLYVDLSEEETQNVEVLFDIMIHEQEREGIYHREIIKNILESILMLFLRKYKSDGKNLKRERMLGYLLENNRYLTEISLTDMAEKFGYTPTHMSTVFKKAVGISFMDEKVLLRIQYATRLILTTDHSIAEISQMSGFGGYVVFAKAFKKYMGMSAKEFKNQNSD